MATTFVGVGAVAEANNSSITPALPGGVAAGDVIGCFGYFRSTGALTAPGGGWTEVYNLGTSGSSRTHGFWYKQATGSDVAPTLGVTGGADQNTVVGFCFAFRPSTGKALILDGLGANSPNGSQADVGPISAPSVAGTDGAVIFFGVRNDDWTGAGTLSGDSLTWAEMVDAISTAWNDLGIACDYAIFTSTPTLTAKTFTITGGGNALGGGRAITLKEVDPATGAYSHTWSAFTGTYEGSAAVDGAYGTTWAVFTGTYEGSAAVDGEYATTWGAFTGSYVGSVPAEGEYSTTWAGFGTTYLGVGEVIPAEGEYSAGWDDFTSLAAGVNVAPPAPPPAEPLPRTSAPRLPAVGRRRVLHEARGDLATAMCPICGFVVRYREMVCDWRGRWVCPDCRDDRPPRMPEVGADIASLAHPKPYLHLYPPDPRTEEQVPPRLDLAPDFSTPAAPPVLLSPLDGGPPQTGGVQVHGGDPGDDGTDIDGGEP